VRSWKIWIAILAAASIVPVAVALQSYPRSELGFDTGSNGLWVGHRWYTGREVRTGDRVPEIELSQLVTRLRKSGIRYIFVHTGPLLADGSIEDSADPLFTALNHAYPEGVFLAWLGARLEKIRLGEPTWRQAVVVTIQRLAEEGFDGVHFNLEPLRDGHPGYLELLADVRARFGDDLIISQATPRSAPFGLAIGPLRRNFWSGGFYRATMDIADQTVLMAYDTRLPFSLAYVAFVRDQTRRLVHWACAAQRHEVLIGVPSYHDSTENSDPEIENIGNAALGVRSALESLSGMSACFRGVSVYAHWVTNDDEWQQFDEVWRRSSSVHD
jgi:hypothetical protein